ncbi:hypothetical protein J6590_080480 [Homalodisca vitripennis]|nr:hypothetical protein J6590_080480 [Homalodisca vitripennis]
MQRIESVSHSITAMFTNYRIEKINPSVTTAQDVSRPREAKSTKARMKVRHYCENVPLPAVRL